MLSYSERDGIFALLATLLLELGNIAGNMRKNGTPVPQSSIRFTSAVGTLVLSQLSKSDLLAKNAPSDMNDDVVD